METESQRHKGREGTISALNAVIKASNLAEEFSSIAPVKAVFGSVRTLFAMNEARLLLLCHDLLQVHTYLGLNGSCIMNWIISSSGYFAPISADRLTGGRMERSWTSSVDAVS